MYIGIDLGGTNTSAALCTVSGQIEKRASLPTDTSGGAATVCAGLQDVCKTLLSGGSAELSAIGVGVPGTVNCDTGEVMYTPNLPISGVNIAKKLGDAYKVPVFLGNDANCAALGETAAGAARGANSVVCITLGTGIGGGIVLGGRLYEGTSGAAAELGHMVISVGGRPCGCGRRGCWEAYASASGLVVTAKELLPSHADSLLLSLSDGDIGKIEGRTVFDAYRAGDGAARQAVGMYISHLAAGIVNIINIFEPEIICVGGGISNAWDCIEAPLLAAVDAERYLRCVPCAPRTKIVRTALGGDAGVIGAAMLCAR